MINNQSASKLQFVIFILISTLFLFSCKDKPINQKISKNKPLRAIPDSIDYKTVRFQTQWLHQAQFAGFYVAYEKGFYRNYGIDVKIEMGGPDNPSPEALKNNKSEFVSMFLTSALREIDKGNEIVNIAQISQKSSLLLVAKKSSGIHKLQDINGKKVGLWMNDFREPSITFLKKNNIKANIIPISWTTNVLAHDVVDIMNMMVYNEYDIFINTGYDPSELTVFPLAEYGVNIPEDGVYCLKDYYFNNRELCNDFAEATLDGWIYALNHEEETLAIVFKYLRISHLPTNIPHQRWMFRKIREAVLHESNHFGKLTEQDYNSAVEMLKRNNVISVSIPYSDFAGNNVSPKN